MLDDSEIKKPVSCQKGTSENVKFNIKAGLDVVCLRLEKNYNRLSWHKLA